MASYNHFMPLYVADYLADTGHLTRDEHGAYMLLIMHYWRMEGLPDNDAQLARIAKCSASEWKRIRPVMLEFFADGWKHERIDRELETARKKYEARAKAGQKGPSGIGASLRAFASATA